MLPKNLFLYWLIDWFIIENICIKSWPSAMTRTLSKSCGGGAQRHLWFCFGPNLRLETEYQDKVQEWGFCFYILNKNLIFTQMDVWVLTYYSEGPKYFCLGFLIVGEACYGLSPSIMFKGVYEARDQAMNSFQDKQQMGESQYRHA